MLTKLNIKGACSACEIRSFIGDTVHMQTPVLPDDVRLFSIDWPESHGLDLLWWDGEAGRI